MIYDLYFPVLQRPKSNFGAQLATASLGHCGQSRVLAGNSFTPNRDYFLVKHEAKLDSSPELLG